MVACLKDMLKVLCTLICIELFCGNRTIGCIIVILFVGGIVVMGCWVAGEFEKAAVTAIHALNTSLPNHHFA